MPLPPPAYARLRPGNGGRHALDRAISQMCANMGRVHAEYNILDLLWSTERITVTEAEHLAACRQGDRPILVFGVHFSTGR